MVELHRIIYAVALTVSACRSDSTATRRTVTPASEAPSAEVPPSPSPAHEVPSPDVPPPVASDDRAGPSLSQWERVRRQYGRLVAVAGKGASDNGNEWSARFERGSAVDAELSRPHFAMADAAGNLYIADKEAHAIRRVDRGGIITTFAGTGEPGAVDDTPGPALRRALANPNGLFVLPDGTVYVVDLDHDRVRKVTPDGVMSTVFQVPGGLAIGRGLWVAPDESEILVASGSAIVRWTPGRPAATWATGFSSLGSLVRVGDLVLAADRGSDRVQAVLADGSTRTLAGGGSEVSDGRPARDLHLDGVRAVWPAHPADGPGFFVGTHEGCQVWFIDEAGIAHLFLDGDRRAHAGDGDWFDAPGKKVSELRSLTLDAQGNVIVVENDLGFVRKVERLATPR